MVPTFEWERPWLAPWREPGERVAHAWAQGKSLPEALNAAAPALRFVDFDALPSGEAYERFVAQWNQCPVIEGLHDFFNGLCWLKFPLAKRQLNRLHMEQIARNGISGRRGPVRDAITLFDENGALLDAPPELWEALLVRQWQRLFVDLRPLWSQARLLIFGHALIEQLASPRKPLTAHVLRVQMAIDPLADLDGALAGALTAETLAAKPFTPLPVLGVPGWCRHNEDPGYYEDPQVFRPLRQPV